MGMLDSSGKGKAGQGRKAPEGHKPDRTSSPEQRPGPVREPVRKEGNVPAFLEQRGPIRTLPDSSPVPVESAEHDLDRPEYYLNRELTWLNFSQRVLNEADDERTPLLERMKFVAIVSSTLDEFFMKRIGGLKQQIGAGLQERTVDGRTPQQQVDECREIVGEIDRKKRRILKRLLRQIEDHGIIVRDYERLSDADREYLRELFIENYYPLITPQATDPAHPFPFVSNLSLNLLVTLRYPNDSELSMARVKVPVGPGVPRFLRLPESNTFVAIEGVIAGNLDLLFPGMEITSVATFRVTRNANTEQDEEEADDLLELIESELRDRKFAPVVRLEVSEDLSPQYRKMLASELGLDEHADVFEVRGMIGMRDLMEVATLPIPELHYPPFHAIDHPELQSDRNIFHIIRESGSVLLHHPYVSFATSVERFLREASADPKVRAIKMALYRTSAESNVIRYLVEAAQNGKQVAVVVELKARFDEEANIRWANRLEEAGIHVTYGVVGLKTHCKVILVVRQDHNGLRRYAHIGTGNYHAETARLYTDTGLLTCDRRIGEDLTELFNYLTTGFKPKRSYKKLLPAPKVCRAALMEKIQAVVAAHQKGKKGLIQFKLNALEDPGFTRALYEAAQAGVKVDLVVRDTCRLRPGIKGLSDNVRVVSVVGRFLEHARIFYFASGDDEEYYIGSADLMSRNLDSRVEALAPVEDEALRQELRAILDLQLDDRSNAWDMHADGSYVQRVPESEDERKDCHEHLGAYYAKRQRRFTRLRRRKPRSLDRRGPT